MDAGGRGTEVNSIYTGMTREMQKKKKKKKLFLENGYKLQESWLVVQKYMFSREGFFFFFCTFSFQIKSNLGVTLGQNHV